MSDEAFAAIMRDDYHELLEERSEHKIELNRLQIRNSELSGDVNSLRADTRDLEALNNRLEDKNAQLTLEKMALSARRKELEEQVAGQPDVDKLVLQNLTHEVYISQLEKTASMLHEWKIEHANDIKDNSKEVEGLKKFVRELRFTLAQESTNESVADYIERILERIDNRMSIYDDTDR